MTDATAAAAARLAAVRAKRGYLLPHHGLLALTAPAVLDAYDATYTALTLTPRVLTEHDKEFVWLGILTATREAIAVHHVRKFKDAGGDPATIDLAIRLAAFAEGAGAFAFAGSHWQAAIGGYDHRAAYLDALERLLPATAPRPGLVHAHLAAVHTCARRWTEVGWHIEAAYRSELPEAELAEALTLTMFPGSVPNFVDACGVWRDLVRAGRVNASPAFVVWAESDERGPAG